MTKDIYKNDFSINTFLINLIEIHYDMDSVKCY